METGKENWWNVNDRGKTDIVPEKLVTEDTYSVSC